MPIVFDGETEIASWTPVIIRGGVFQVPITFYDEAGDPDPVLSAEIVITPNGAAGLSWTQANGLFQSVGTGEFTTALDEAYTTALTWSTGTYRIQIVDSSGFTVPCITEGLIFVKDC